MCEIAICTPCFGCIESAFTTTGFYLKATRKCERKCKKYRLSNSLTYCFERKTIELMRSQLVKLKTGEKANEAES